MASISAQLGLPQIYKDVKTKSIERTLLPLVKQVSTVQKEKQFKNENRKFHNRKNEQIFPTQHIKSPANLQMY